MRIDKTYNPKEVESKWYEYWLANDFFAAVPDKDKPPFCIVIPPPNITGVLHMGHVLNNTIQDILIRKARMAGKQACWVAGTDHASIATEAKVLKMLKQEKGIEKKDLTRTEFLTYAWQWRDKYGGIILEQLKKLGASCDWPRTRFTMDADYYREVIQVFVDLYDKGLIYRGVRMVNWDPQGKTALSDEEVIYEEIHSKLYYLTYPIKGSNERVTIATTRPETMLGDTAVCVHPKDARFTHLIGKKAVVPIVDREVPIIADDYVDPAYGTGCLKVTPAHDLNDHEIGLRHNLEVIDILADDGKLNEKAQYFVGEDRFVAREKIAKMLTNKGHLIKVEEIVNKVGFSERTHTIVEPRLSRQWFMRMGQLSKPALENVLNNNIRFYPKKFKNTYKHWMENIRDWCISRQLWWGHSIPAYYLPDGSFVVAQSLEKALELARLTHPHLTAKDLKQDEDVLDTWASSWLWPIAVFNGIKQPNNEDISYFYPTDVLVTAPEILFFWVARMIMAGYEYRQELPFKNVYLTGIVRDKLRRKMSKSLGNSPNPLALIEKYGADGVRAGMLFSSPAGNDLLFDERLCEQGRNFSNKIWNAFRLLKGWKIDEKLAATTDKTAVAWFDARLNQALAQIATYFDHFRINDALITLYKLIWGDFCSWYLEMIKPAYQQPIALSTYAATILFFEKLIRSLHPFMPFITEEIWHNIRERKPHDCIIVAPYPTSATFDRQLLAQGVQMCQLISNIRNIRNEKQLSPSAKLNLYVITKDKSIYTRFAYAIVKLANVNIYFRGEKTSQTISFVLNTDEFFIPLDNEIDPDIEREKLTKELTYTKGFLLSVMKKLDNKRFVANAPQRILDKEKQKKVDAENKMKTLEKALALIK